MKNTNPDFDTRNSKFIRIANMIYNLDIKGNLTLDFYKMNHQVSPSIFDTISFKDKRGICTIDIDRYIVSGNAPIFSIRMINRNFQREESFWIENPDTFSADRLGNLIQKYHDLEQLESLQNVIDDVYNHNNGNK